MSVGALDWDLAVEGLEIGGRIVCFLCGPPTPVLSTPAILTRAFRSNAVRNGEIFKILGYVYSRKHVGETSVEISPV